MNRPNLTGETIRIGDSVQIVNWEGTVEEIVVAGCPQWNEYWREVTGEGDMLVGPQFGRLINKFHDEDLVLVNRKRA